MGTTYTVQVTRVPAGTTEERLAEEIAASLKKVDDHMSTYRADSELSRFNESDRTDWIEASPDLVEVVEEALRVSRMTGGAFDVTVGPLVNLWGFGSLGPREQPPSPEEMRQASPRIGYEKLQVRRDPPAILKQRGDIYVDLSAIAKGYAVDKVAERLEALGIRDYLVEVGGELRGLGLNFRGVPWRVAVERPAPDARSVQEIVAIGAMGMATSGDYRNFIESGGRRFSHMIDPRTHRPVVHGLASVTVLDTTAMRADALATGLMVLGMEDGIALSEKEHLAALFIVRDQDSFVQRSTSAFGRAVVQ